MSEDKKIEIKKGESKSEEEKIEDKKSRELSIRRESPFSLFQQMDRMFDNMWRDFDDNFWWPFGRRRVPLSLSISEDEPLFRTPLTNISEDDNTYTISAEVPGLDKEDLEITISEGNLEIKGEMQQEKKEEKEGELVRRECVTSSYYRAFALPENIDEDDIDANLDKGILTIKIPKVEPPEPVKKKIEVK
ncbi:MAG: Hsp20 family protein [Candidatus Lokiarchaeota archaeon]|nr:Hsp20 family protein [Candidatus Lokiarchaeota archaeon]MBD3342641.1 Hsp20 family protein [Candidatus Lokiarchaeota archaeon]